MHSITLSSEQLALARDRIARAGQADRVEVELLDYRALLESPATAAAYDAVVSVEMIEAVGWRFWPTYFRTLDHVLAPGGRVALQAITMPHDRMLATRDTHTFITKYIFPGGALPSVRAIEETAARHTSLRVVDQLPSARTTPAPSGCGTTRSPRPRRGRSPRVRRHLPAVVALLPGVQPRRVRLGLHRRPPADPHQGSAVTAVATRLADALTPFVGGELPVRLVAWDGSAAGPDDAPRVEIRSPDALRRLLWQPGELGAAQAYVTGQLDVPGDLDAALTHAFGVAREREPRGGSGGSAPYVGARAVRTAAGLGAIGRPPAAPATQAGSAAGCTARDVTGWRSATTTT